MFLIVSLCDTTKYGYPSCTSSLLFALTPTHSHLTSKKKQSKLQFYVLKTNQFFIFRWIILILNVSKITTGCILIMYLIQIPWDGPWGRRQQEDDGDNNRHKWAWACTNAHEWAQTSKQTGLHRCTTLMGAVAVATAPAENKWGGQHKWQDQCEWVEEGQTKVGGQKVKQVKMSRDEHEWVSGGMGMSGHRCIMDTSRWREGWTWTRVVKRWGG